MKSSGVDDNMVIADLPIQLRTEVRLQLYQNLVEGIPIFDSASVGFLVSLVMKLKTQVCMPGDALIHQGEIGSEMYVVKSGRLVAYITEDDGDDEDSDDIESRSTHVLEEKKGISGGKKQTEIRSGSSGIQSGRRRSRARRQSLSIDPTSIHEDLGSFKKKASMGANDVNKESTNGGDEREIGFLNAGDYFGELALLFRRARTASVVTCTYSEVLILASADYEKVARVFTADAQLVMTAAMRLMNSSTGDRRPSLEVGCKNYFDLMWC